MKPVSRIRFLVAVLALAAVLTACGTTPDAPADETDVSASAAEPAETLSDSVQETKKTTTTKPAAETTTAKKDAQKAKEKETQPEKHFAVGTWNNGDDLEYTFNADGTGTLKQVQSGESTAFRYELEPKKSKIIFYMGTDSKKTPATYSVADETHMTLTYKDKRTESLTMGVLLTQKSVPFAMGDWSDDNGVKYTFRIDGTGTVAYPDGSASTAFHYEVNPSSHLILLQMEGSEELSPAVYQTPDKTHLHLIFDNGNTVSLTKTEKPKSTEKSTSEE